MCATCDEVRGEILAGPPARRTQNQTQQALQRIAEEQVAGRGLARACLNELVGELLGVEELPRDREAEAAWERRRSGT